MSTAQETSNKATVRRFCDAANSGDAELISKTIDELVAPDALMRTPLPIEATGVTIAKGGVREAPAAYPDLHITIRGSGRGGGQGRLPRHGHRNPPGRIHGHPTNRQIRHVRRDLHRPVRGRPNRRDLGRRRRPLADAAARRDSRRRRMTIRSSSRRVTRYRSSAPGAVLPASPSGSRRDGSRRTAVSRRSAPIRARPTRERARDRHDEVRDGPSHLRRARVRAV